MIVDINGVLARGTNSSLWKNMVKLWQTLEENCLWSVRDGRTVDFCKLAWIDDRLKLSDLQLAIPEEMKHVKAVELLDDRGAWNWSLIQDWVPEHICIK
jgi:hypothetical protein